MSCEADSEETDQTGRACLSKSLLFIYEAAQKEMGTSHANGEGPDQPFHPSSPSKIFRSSTYF